MRLYQKTSSLPACLGAVVRSTGNLPASSAQNSFYPAVFREKMVQNGKNMLNKYGYIVN
jgi:hypothetical protein